ncbi:hypothetical protein [Phyllobacterium sp. P5_D12]
MAESGFLLWTALPWGALATVLAATVGALVVVWQNAKQARRATDQMRHTEAIKLKMKVYEEIVGLCRDAGRAEIEYSGFVAGFSTDLKLYRDMTAVGLKWTIPKARPRALFDKQEQFNRAVIDMVSVTERWGVMHPGLEMYRLAFNVAMHEANAAFDPYRSLASRWMPMDNPDATGAPSTFPWSLPNDQIISQIDVAANALTEGIGEFGNYIYDFQIDMQNLLLGDLFSHRIPPREPLNPKYVVARLDDHVALKKYFETETEWGKHKTEVEERVRKANEQSRQPA